MLFLTTSTFAADPVPPAQPAATSVPNEWTVKTESGVSTADFSDCPQCIRVLNENPVNAQGEQLVINWERLQSRYSFNSLSKEDQAALLRELGPGDRETLAERSARLKIKPPTFATGNNGDTIQDRMSSGVGRRLGLGNGAKVKVKVGKNKFQIKYEKKF
jgi:hypothetical protein